TGSSCSPELLVLHLPARALLEGDTVTLRCRGWQNKLVTWLSFDRDEKDVRLLLSRTELSLSPLQLHHSGRYCCKGWVHSDVPWWRVSVPVPVTVHGEHPTATT
ncbi:FCGR3 protein, partial [Erpornis zantholeuca]|nr:FCGR3 protein [Erpornis zantholeuca]